MIENVTDSAVRKREIQLTTEETAQAVAAAFRAGLIDNLAPPQGAADPVEVICNGGSGIVTTHTVVQPTGSTGS